MASFQPYTDPAKNAFVKTNLFFTDNAFLQTQDPTVLGFKLFFNFDQPNSGLLWGSGMAEPTDAPINTALWFLNKIGDTQRAHYLRKFLYLLHGINNQTPWYFQEIGGLADAWKRDLDKPLLVDKKIEITCLESIDLRVTALLDLYRKACFDWKYRREVIPVNLRQFDLLVYVYEARFIQNPNDIALTNDTADVEYGFGGNLQGDLSRRAAEATGRLTGPNETLNDPNTPNVNVTLGVPMSTTRNMFRFSFCEFDHMEADHLSAISNSAPADAKQKIVIKYQDVEEVNMYNFWDQNLVSDGWIPSLDNAALDSTIAVEPGVPQSMPNRIPDDRGRIGAFLDNLQQQGQSKLDQIKGAIRDATNLDNIKENAFDRAEDFIEGQLTRLFLGNVFGFSAADLANPQKLVTKGLDAGRSIVNDRRFRSVSGDNVYSTPSPSNANVDPPNSPNDNVYFE
jgi:hypothetical protein